MSEMFENLFIFEMANNHQGDLQHGLAIIRSMAEIAKKENIKAGVKFQFRDLDTFIHPHYLNDNQQKHIQRFISTRLDWNDFEVLKNEVSRLGLITICTPFDESSVDQITKMNFDIIKVASCSVTDYPLLQKIKSANKPTIFSTAGASFAQTDRIVNLFNDNRDLPLALLHCVALYPTPSECLQLNRIAALKLRYPEWTIGFSTHEDPNNYNAVQMAYALGARIFEKHVALEFKNIKPNAYSATPEQITKWIAAYKEAKNSCGSSSDVHTTTEKKSLLELQRGVYLKKSVNKMSPIKRSDVFFAMPVTSDKHMTIEDWCEDLMADQDYAPNAPLTKSSLNFKQKKTLQELKKEILDLART
ncbi:MAG: N-acetylneuraminate synthase family protein, partial [Bdellovibrionaceae bacterium]|nr:N-acetylneuraminate synthase family protein [Pseudobdellovibrionaceae bacterium]